MMLASNMNNCDFKKYTAMLSVMTLIFKYSMSKLAENSKNIEI